MQRKSEIIERQKSFIDGLKQAAAAYIATVPKESIETILLSGSLARGDYFPGEFGGMIDLTVMLKKGAQVSPDELFGKNEDPYIPYHCVKRDGNWYQIALHDFIDESAFVALGEAKKFALLESTLLWESDNKYASQLGFIQNIAAKEITQLKQNSLGYINYLLSDYKQDRWRRREAFAQLHYNLNTAIQESIKCLFYRNSLYAPAEDRRLYYSYELASLPDNYESALVELMQQNLDSAPDYERRALLFNSVFLPFIAAAV